MDKITLTNHIRDIDLKNKMYKVIDKANACLKNYDITHINNVNLFASNILLIASFCDIMVQMKGE
jgi:hypothetical protein